MAGHELVLNHLVSDLSIDRRTAARYLDLLEEMRLVRRLPGLAGIDAFRARYGERFRRGLVMYAGRHVLPLGNAVWAVPISVLWSR